MLGANHVSSLYAEEEQLPLGVAFDLFEVGISVLYDAAFG
jgi:hypothetical protein